MNTRTCDVLVIGAGAGGLATAITAKKHGLDVLVIEKDDCFGGTTAFFRRGAVGAGQHTHRQRR